jgi:hypothetical protein
MPSEEAYIRRQIAGLRADRFVSGCAYGADTVAMLEAWQFLNCPEYVLTIPVGKKYNAGLEYFGERNGWTLEYIKGGYMARNDRTIELATELHAFPATPDEILRSGTWATIRRAKRKGIPVCIHPLCDA